MQQRSRCPLLSPTPRGIHHLALCTDDIKATIDFYVDVLGMPLVHAMRVPPGLGAGPRNRGNPPYERIRHYFFDMGNESLLAFFEIPKGKQPASNRNAIGAMQHCAFVVTAEHFREVEAWLKSRGVDYIGPIPQLPGFSASTSMTLTVSVSNSRASQRTVRRPRSSLASPRRGAEARSELITLPGATPEWIEKNLASLPE